MRSDTKSKQNNVRTKSAKKQTQFQAFVAARVEAAHTALHADDRRPTEEEKEKKAEARAAFLRRKGKGLK